jgi:hypothetical protein
LGYDENMTVLWLAVLPMVLWFVEQVLPFPALIEELGKAIFVYRAKNWREAAGLGLVFGLAEAVLFLVNANQLQTMTSWLGRLLLTVPMHGVTAAIMFKFGRFGLVLAILIHFWFNLKIAS